MVYFFAFLLSSFAFIIAGLICFISRNEIDRGQRYAFSIIMPMLFAGGLSYALASVLGFEGLSGCLLHCLCMVALWMLFVYIFRGTYRMAKFYGIERENYSIGRYFRWRKSHLCYEKIANAALDEESAPLKVTFWFVILALGIFIISLAVIYIPKPKVSADFAISDPIEHCSIEIPEKGEFYDGLPANEHQIVWWASSKMTLGDVTLSLVTDKRNIKRRYWMLNVDNLPEDARKLLPSSLSGVVFLEEWRVVVRRSDGEIL